MHKNICVVHEIVPIIDANTSVLGGRVIMLRGWAALIYTYTYVCTRIHVLGHTHVENGTETSSFALQTISIKHWQL